MECVTFSEMKKELKDNGYNDIDDMPTYKVIELWQKL